jgi:DNA repair protein RadA/Sms
MELVVESSAGRKISSKNTTPPSGLWTVSELNKEDNQKMSTGVKEFDRLLGGGLVNGQVVLIGAEPGFGKSTLCLEILGKIAGSGKPVLYASGEESAIQIGERARRLGETSDNLKIISTTSVEDVMQQADAIEAEIVCVDSLQAMASASVDGSIGGISQSKEASLAFKDYAKRTNVPFLLISQFTKSDEVAGSNQIPHVVDTILVGDADKDTPLKFLRSRKNRYGVTGVTGVFVHENNGLRSVQDPSRYLMGAMNADLAGSAMTMISDGGRLLPVEIDALVAPAAYGNPQRRFDGLQSQRATTRVARLMVSAEELNLDQNDVFVGSVNGIKINDASSDLAMLASIVSSALHQPPNEYTMWIGEVSLTGQVRGRTMIQEKVREAIRLGFSRVIIPSMAIDAIPKSLSHKITVTPVDMIEDILHLI